MAVKPLEDRIVIKTNESQTRTASSIVMADTATEMQNVGTGV